jgi:hypothetical protein
VTADEVELSAVAPGALLASALELVTGARDPDHACSRLLTASVRLARLVQIGQLDRVLAIGVLVDAAEHVGVPRLAAFEVVGRGLARRPAHVGGDQVAPR